MSVKLRNIAIALAVGLCSATSAFSASADSVLLLHGYNDKADSSGQNDAWNCQTNWANQRAMLRAYGHSGRIQAVGYYSDNLNCDRNLASSVYTKNFSGNMNLQSPPANPSVLTYNTSMVHVAYRFAWAAAKERIDNGGRPIHVICDSLGGLVVRQAIAMASAGNPDFPTLAQLNILSVYTYGTPFYGTPLGGFGSNGTTQGNEANTGSNFLTNLNSAGMTRVGSAQWFSITSNAIFGGDRFISGNSACWLRSSICIRYRNPAYTHGAYKDDANTTNINNAFEYRMPVFAEDWNQASANRRAPFAASPGAAAYVSSVIQSR
jgi:hypothetical protein